MKYPIVFYTYSYLHKPDIFVLAFAKPIFHDLMQPTRLPVLNSVTLHNPIESLFVGPFDGQSPAILDA